MTLGDGLRVTVGLRVTRIHELRHYLGHHHNCVDSTGHLIDFLVGGNGNIPDTPGVADDDKESADVDDARLVFAMRLVYECIAGVSSSHILYI